MDDTSGTSSTLGIPAAGAAAACELRALLAGVVVNAAARSRMSWPAQSKRGGDAQKSRRKSNKTSRRGCFAFERCVRVCLLEAWFRVFMGADRGRAVTGPGKGDRCRAPSSLVIKQGGREGGDAKKHEVAVAMPRLRRAAERDCVCVCTEACLSRPH